MARCSERIWVDRWHTQCLREAVIERDGRTYCRIHDPEYIEIKRAKRKAKYQVRTHPDSGTAGIMKVRKYRVINFAELPDQYKIENSALLNKVVKAGIPSIPGVEIYNEETLRVTTK